ncbi:MAG: amidohydrolase family protein [Betaproteobacteria bacterium]|nr:amidohydrolase family protein [Betaproteobacteria bacterium]
MAALDHSAYVFRGNAYRNLADLDAWTRQREEAALEPDLPIIDPHHHVWDNRHGRYLIDELAADVASGHNVVATVFIECGTAYRGDGPVEMRPVGEVEFANGIAAMSASGHYGKARLCAGLIGHADLTLGKRVQPVLEALIAAGNGRLRGIRHGVTWDTGNAARFGRREVPQHQVLDPTFREGFACLQPLGLTFESWQFHPQLPDAVDLLRAFPEANVILNHAGGLLGIAPHDGNRDEVFAIWRGHMRRLTQFPNLTVKIGGLGMLYCGWDFHLRDMPPGSEELAAAWRPYVETCIELFGVERCMMESNFPVDKQSCGYGVLWNALKRITQQCSAAEKAALYRDTAARVYRLAVQ